MNNTQKLALIYLYMVPIAVAAIGFGIGPVSYKLYVPLWLIHVCLMGIAASYLSKQRKPAQDQARTLAISAALLFLPWVLFSIFAGMGPPPATAAKWLEKETEQRIRYSILIFGGLAALLGFGMLKLKLQSTPSQLPATLGFTLLNVATPLFILNMTYWGYYLPEAFRGFMHDPARGRPDWYLSLQVLFYNIACIEVGLIYLSTIFFADAMKGAGLLSSRSCRWYQIFGGLGLLLVFVPTSWPDPLSTLGYLAAVPAIPFIMPYLMGVQILKGRQQEKT